MIGNIGATRNDPGDKSCQRKSACGRFAIIDFDLTDVRHLSWHRLLEEAVSKPGTLHEAYLAVRLQEFFGMKDTPRIARGQVPLVLLLLAPSMRPVQTTSDLPGFWQRWYPQISKELMRRYPKHKWPENPEVHS
jgi:HrpA-like RNA helicase